MNSKGSAHSLGADGDRGNVTVYIVGDGRGAGRRAIVLGETGLVFRHSLSDRLADLLGDWVGDEVLASNWAGDGRDSEGDKDGGSEGFNVEHCGRN